MIGSSQTWSSLSLPIRYPQRGGRMGDPMLQHSHGRRHNCSAPDRHQSKAVGSLWRAVAHQSNVPHIFLPRRYHEGTIVFCFGSIMIQPQVHLRLPCYDFCPVQVTAIKSVSSDPSLRRGYRPPVPDLLEMTQSRAATGGVYKGQGRNQSELMTRTYLEFLVHGK